MSFLLLPELNTPEILAEVRPRSLQEMGHEIGSIYVIYTAKYPHSLNHRYGIRFCGFPSNADPHTYSGGWNLTTGVFDPFTTNCGMLAITAPYVRVPNVTLQTLYVELLEAYLFYIGVSLVVGSDVHTGPYYDLIKNYGKDWVFTTVTHNRNYPAEPNRLIGMYYKAVGEYGSQYVERVAQFSKNQ